MPVDRAAPSGTRLITSTPPATTTSCCPDITAWAAKSSACWLDPQARLTVVPGIVSGQPAASTAKRPMLLDWSPTCETQPQITSSITAGSTPVRSISAPSTTADRSAACICANPPPRLPTGVRTASMITASRILLLRSDRPPAGERRVPFLGEGRVGLTDIRSGEITRLGARLVGQRLRERALRPRIQQPLAVGQRDRWARRQATPQVLDEGVDPVLRLHPGD